MSQPPIGYCNGKRKVRLKNGGAIWEDNATAHLVYVDDRDQLRAACSPRLMISWVVYPNLPPHAPFMCGNCERIAQARGWDEGDDE